MASKLDVDEWLEGRCRLWPSCSKEEHLKEISECLSNSKNINLIARADNLFCGFLETSVRTYASGCTSRPVLFLEGIWVKPELQRKGVGEKLINFLEKLALEQGFKEIYSDCEISNEHSQQAHTRWGFSEIERVVCYRKEIYQGFTDDSKR